MSCELEAKQVRTSSLGWMIQRLARRLSQAMETRLDSHGLSLSQFAVMMTVLENDGLSQTEIGDRLGQPPYATSRAIDHLESVGLLERRPHPTSRRTHTVHATAAARALSRDLFAIVQEVNDTLAAPLSDQERATFLTLLTKVM